MTINKEGLTAYGMSIVGLLTNRVISISPNTSKVYKKLYKHYGLDDLKKYDKYSKRSLRVLSTVIDMGYANLLNSKDVLLPNCDYRLFLVYLTKCGGTRYVQSLIKYSPLLLEPFYNTVAHYYPNKASVHEVLTYLRGLEGKCPKDLLNALGGSYINYNLSTLEDPMYCLSLVDKVENYFK